MVTLDSGFVNTAGCTSAITYIDDDAGVLRYRRGYPIGQLAEHSTFLEISPGLCRSARCAACRGVPGRAATSLSSQKVHSGQNMVIFIYDLIHELLHTIT